MRFLAFRTGLLSLLCVAAMSASAAGQRPPPESGYGTEDLQVVNVPFSRFLPIQSVTTYGSSCCDVSFVGERWPTAGVGVLMAEIDAGLVPNGAILEEVAFYVHDSDVGTGFLGQLCRTWTDLDGQNPSADCPLTIQTTGVPGDTMIAEDPNLEVRYVHDVDADAADEQVNYVLWASFGAMDGSVKLRSARLLFRRQVSPAPAVATFNDVPTSHPFFQFVEALAASGITAGCGTGIYCPDAPLTRGQMAVFLAKALGLHWPAP